MEKLPLILILALTSGQLIKFFPKSLGNVTLLDLTVLALDILGLFIIKFKLPKPPNWIIAGLTFIFLASLSLLLTPLKLNSNEYLTSLAYTVRLSIYLFLGWLISSGIFPQIKKKISEILLYSGLILAILGLLQLILIPDLGFLQIFGWDPHYFRTVSTFLDPNFLGAYLTLTLLILTAQGQNLPRNYFFPAFITVYLALLTTFSRSATVLFLVSFCTLAILKRSKKIFLLTALFTVGFSINFISYNKTIAEPQNIDRQQSAKYRLSTWQQGWEIFQSSPILGVGFNSYRYALREKLSVPESFLQSRGSSTNDSSMLFVAATTGILGLLFYLLFLGSLIKTAFSKQRQGLILVAAILGLLVNSFFLNSLFYPWVLFWLILKTSEIS